PAFGARLGAWIEVHVEQGRGLADVPAALGVGTSLARRERWSGRVQGEAGHAGTTPMAVRRDALLPAARVALAADRRARAEAGVVATVGELLVRPGATNVIPGEVRFTLDVRAVRADALARVRDGIQEATGGQAGDATVAWQRETADPGAVFDQALRDA